jgi:uncharacterized protein (TIGR01777 family)
MRKDDAMQVAVTGASGLIGTALVHALREGGHGVKRLVRRPPRAPDEAQWDVAAGRLDPAVLDGCDAVVHLAGEPIGARRWTAAQKARIRDSRVDGTRLLAETLAALPDGPRALVCASGVGYYGDRGDEVLTEDSDPGVGFLADLVQAWERAADAARGANVRVVHLRTGIVLTASGGALARLLPLFRLGLGGRFGSGRQYMSWISLDDEVGLYLHALTNDAMSGPVNATAPNPVTNAELTRILAAVLHRPALLPIPRFGPRLVLGQLAEELLFFGQRVIPAKALDTRYDFRHATLEPALRDLLAP